MSETITGIYGAGERVAVAMVDLWLAEGREFTPHMAATEVALHYLRVAEASYGRGATAGAGACRLVSVPRLSRGQWDEAIRVHHDTYGYRALMTPLRCVSHGLRRL